MGDNKPLQDHLWPLYPRLVDLGSSLLRWRSIWTRDFDGTGTITVPTPVNNTDAATKLYVDDRIGLFTIREVDLAPSVASVTILEFDQADGFVLTNPSAGRVRVDLGTLPVGVGGTGLLTYTIGDLIYASAATVLTSLADVAAGAYLRSGGVGVAPLWSTATLPNTATTGDLLYASGANVYANLADVAAGSYLRSGGVGVAPAWAVIAHTELTAIGTNTHAQIDTHLAASAAVHGLGANVNVLGNRAAAGEFVQRASLDPGALAGAGGDVYSGTTAVTFAVAFSSTPFVAFAGMTDNAPIVGSAIAILTTGCTIQLLGINVSQNAADARYIALGA